MISAIVICSVRLREMLEEQTLRRRQALRQPHQKVKQFLPTSRGDVEGTAKTNEETNEQIVCINMQIDLQIQDLENLKTKTSNQQRNGRRAHPVSDNEF